MKFAKAAAVIAGAALGVLSFAGVASAHDGDAKAYVDEHRDGAKALQLGDDLCAAPWYWEGPGNAGNTNKSVDYDACSQNRHGADDTQASVSVLNDACIAPWHWNGPLNVLNTNTAADYQAC